MLAIEVPVVVAVLVPGVGVKTVAEAAKGEAGPKQVRELDVERPQHALGQEEHRGDLRWDGSRNKGMSRQLRRPLIGFDADFSQEKN